MIKEASLINLKGNVRSMTNFTMVSAGLKRNQNHACNQFCHLVKDYDQSNRTRQQANFANQLTKSATMFLCLPFCYYWERCECLVC